VNAGGSGIEMIFNLAPSYHNQSPLSHETMKGGRVVNKSNCFPTASLYLSLRLSSEESSPGPTNPAVWSKVQSEKSEYGNDEGILREDEISFCYCMHQWGRLIYGKQLRTNRPEIRARRTQERSIESNPVSDLRHAMHASVESSCLM